jgi:hypothetical protein
MSDPFGTVAIVDSATPHGGYLESIVRAAARFARPLPSAHSARERARLARSVDALLAIVARARGAIDIAIGERLDAMRVRGLRRRRASDRRRSAPVLRHARALGRAPRTPCDDLPVSSRSTRRREVARRQQPRKNKTLQQKVRDRDHGLCQVPFCSRAGLPVHHIIFRGRGGTNAMTNLTCLCAAHHHIIHMGWIRVWGEAPDKLHWQLGVRPGLPPLYEFVTTEDGAIPLEAAA